MLPHTPLIRRRSHQSVARRRENDAVLPLVTHRLPHLVQQSSCASSEVDAWWSIRPGPRWFQSKSVLGKGKREPPRSSVSHSAPFFAALESFWPSLLQRGANDLYTG